MGRNAKSRVFVGFLVDFLDKNPGFFISPPFPPGAEQCLKELSILLDLFCHKRIRKAKLSLSHNPENDGSEVVDRSKFSLIGSLNQNGGERGGGVTVEAREAQ